MIIDPRELLIDSELSLAIVCLLQCNELCTVLLCERRADTRVFSYNEQRDQHEKIRLRDLILWMHMARQARSGFGWFGFLVVFIKLKPL